MGIALTDTTCRIENTRPSTSSLACSCTKTVSEVIQKRQKQPRNPHNDQVKDEIPCQAQERKENPKSSQARRYHTNFILEVTMQGDQYSYRYLASESSFPGFYGGSRHIIEVPSSQSEYWCWWMGWNDCRLQL